MANNLTGDYEAVLQVSVRQINGLLATLHQNGGVPGKSPSLPHESVDQRVGGTPKILDPHIFQFSQWLAGEVQKLRGSLGPSSTQVISPIDVGAQLAATSPPGIVSRFNIALRDLVAARDEVLAPGTVRGLADVQISTPAISLAGSQVVVHVYVRASYLPENGSAALPGPVHGEVRIYYHVVPRTINGKGVLEIQVPSDDGGVRFFPAPGSGVSQADADSKIAVHIRKAVQGNFKPTPVDLGAGFKFFEFKGLGGFGGLHDPHWVEALGTGDQQALALPVQLSGNPAPPGAINSVTNLFLGTGSGQADFAIAVGKEFIVAKFAPTLNNLRQFQKDITVHVTDIGVVDPDYHVSVSSAELLFENGAMNLEVHAKATTDHIIAPNYNNIVINQRLRLVLAAQGVTLAQPADGDLTISGITGLFADEARPRVRSEIVAARDQALNPPPPGTPPTAAISDAFQSTLNQVNGGLHAFDDSASASYTAVEINPDGIIVRGAIETAYHYDPEMQIDYSSDGQLWTALHCWIRGGRIDRFIWRWVEAAVFVAPNAGGPGISIEWTIPWFGTPKSDTKEHQFTYPIPSDLKGRPAWSKAVCLTIEGIQVSANGIAIPVAGDLRSGTCSVTSHEPILEVNPGWEAVYRIFFGVDPVGPSENPEDVIAGHVNLLTRSARDAGIGTNALVHFTGAQIDQPMEALTQALMRVGRSDFALTSVMVLPRGTLARPAREITRQLGLVEQHSVEPTLVGEARTSNPEGARDSRRPFTGRLIITEDYTEGWARIFAASETPSTYLMNARGEFVWKQEGRLEPERLSAALAEHLSPSFQFPTPPLRLTVQPGDGALDFQINDERGQVLALRRLRGRPVLLTFWQSWSSPCVKELCLLQQIHAAGGRHAPVIIAVNGGEDRNVIEEVRRQHRLTIALVPDADQRIARLYGVSCWPTTVAINEEGIVNRIQFGASHDHRAESTDKPLVTS